MVYLSLLAVVLLDSNFDMSVLSMAIDSIEDFYGGFIASFGIIGSDGFYILSSLFGGSGLRGFWNYERLRPRVTSFYSLLLIFSDFYGDMGFSGFFTSSA